MAIKVPECSSVYLAIVHKVSSSVLRAIVLPKLMLEPNLQRFVHTYTQAVAACSAGLRFQSSYMLTFLL